MICDVIAVGTELLLGPVVDTNSTWIGERLAEAGINSYLHTAVGDNQARMVQAIKSGLERADALVITGGLGPTQDDITREAIAEAIGVELVLDDDALDRLHEIFRQRSRHMPDSNKRQAYRPEGSSVILQDRGTAPGLICPVGNKVIYALPGVPSEMQEMVTRAVIPDLTRRNDDPSVILSRHLRTWGYSEAAVAEKVAPRLDALEKVGNPTIAFLAKAAEGIHVRVTAKGKSAEEAKVLLDREEAELRAILGDSVFGVDEQSMESVIGNLLALSGRTLAVAESMTGGMLAHRITSVPGAANWFRGGVVSYASEVKYDLLDVPRGPVISAECARGMALGVKRRLDSDVGIGITGVAGPTTQEDQPIGTVFVSVAIGDDEPIVEALKLGGTREIIREVACINALNVLRLQLLEGN